MKEFIKLLIFYQDLGLIHKKNYSEKSTFYNYINFFLKIKNLNKFQIIFNLRNFIIKIVSIIYLPIGFLFYCFNIRLVVVNSQSLGSYIEEIENILIFNEKKKFNLIFFSPNSFTYNHYFEKFFLKKKITIFKKDIFSIFFVPLSFINFIKVTPYNYLNKKIFFERQYYYFKKEKLNGVFDHEIFANKLKKNKKIFSFSKNKTSIIKEEVLNKLNTQNKKICVIHVRNEPNIISRNHSFKNLKKTIKYLSSKNYIILNFNKKKSGFKNLNYFEFNVFDKKNLELQIKSYIAADLFIGSLSGPGILAKALNKKSVFTNSIIFNYLIFYDDVNVLSKRFYKNKKILNIKKIFENNLECVWDNEIFKKNKIKLIENNNEEIFKATYELLNKKVRSKYIISYLRKNKIYFKNYKFALIRFLSQNFAKKNKICSD